MLEHIKSEIKKLYITNPEVTISIRKPSPKAVMQRQFGIISGVYKNIFQIESNNNGHTSRTTFQYADVLNGNVVIEELQYTPKEIKKK